MLVTIRDRVAAMMDDGLGLDAVLAARPSREFDQAWASDRVGPDDWVRMVYQSLALARKNTEASHVPQAR
jgi:hypothetical protein